MNRRNKLNGNFIRTDVINLAISTDRAINNHGIHISKLYKLAKRQAKAGVMLSLAGIAICYVVYYHETRITKLEREIDILSKELDDVQLQLEHTRFKDEGDI